MAYQKRSEGYYIAGGLIDSEWENLQEMTKDDLWIYLTEYGPAIKEGLTREESDYLWENMLK